MTSLWVETAWLIPVLPFIAFLICGLLGWAFRDACGYISTLLVGGSLFLSFMLFISVIGWWDPATPTSPGVYLDVEQTWISLAPDGPTGDLTMGLLIDQVSAMLILIVSLLCMLITLYSIGYMSADPDKPRYFAEISLFIVGMQGMVLSSNFLEMFVFWEMMGLCSYLLIGFWYSKPEAASAAKKAFLVTRIGDVLFLLGIVMTSLMFGTLRVTAIEEAISSHSLADPRSLVLPSLLFFGGAVGKSAQFPLHIWLPDAMEGPTPVSALIHAATMVKAGVFLVARMLHAGMVSFVSTPETMLVIAGIGSFTALFAATIALAHNDIKRVLAYSTISQLGYMFLALGAGALSAGMFHLMSHAFTKALLFLCAGSVIHAVGTNDMREMGGLHSKMRITSITMLVGSLAMAGFPLFSIFWSKDEVLHESFLASAHSPWFGLFFLFGFVTAFLTAFYMFRLWFMTFTGRYRGKAKVHESPPVMTVPLALLSLFTMGAWLVMGFGGVGGFLEGEPESIAGSLESAGPFILGSVAAFAVGLYIAYRFYYNPGRLPPFIFRKGSLARWYHRVLLNRYYIDDACDAFALKVVYGFSRVCRWFDEKVVDGVVNAISRSTVVASRTWRFIQTGRVQDYGAAIVLGLIAMLLMLLWVHPILGGGA